MAEEQPATPPSGETSDRDWERSKWHADHALRERELTIKEAELELRRKEHAAAGWRSPLVVAILAAALGAAGNAFVSYINSSLERQLEDQKSEQQRLLEVIKTGDPDSAAENLRFLVDAGLVTQPGRVDKIRGFLKTRKPGSGPALPSPSSSGPFSGGIIGVDDAVPAKTLAPDNVIARSARAVGQVRITMDSGGKSMCTGFVVGQKTIITASSCVENASAALFVLMDAGREVTSQMTLPATTVDLGDDAISGYAVLTRETGTFKASLRLANRPPTAKERLALIMFRGSGEQLVVTSDECRALEIRDEAFTHGCDTGPGSSGAPLLSADGKIVYGVHVTREAAGGVAFRADRIER